MSKFIILALFLIGVSPAFGQAYTQWKAAPGLYVTEGGGHRWVTHKEGPFTYTIESSSVHHSRLENNCQWMHNCRSRYQQ